MPVRKAARKLLFWFVLSATVAPAACRPLTGPEPTAVSTESSLSTPQPTATASPTPSAGVSTLVLWVPPAFRSDSNSPGGNLLQSRIQDFEAGHAGVDVVVRVKAATGTGGLRDSLAAAASAAPGALPDLIALDQPNLRAAAVKGLVFPLDGLLPPEAFSEQYPFTGELAVVDDQHFGLPFAGDAIVLANTVVPPFEPLRWEDAHAWVNPMVLPLGDSRSLILFYGYYAAGGARMVSVAEAQIDPAPLEQELEWLLTMQESEVLSARSLQVDSFEASFLAITNFGESSATMYSIASGAGDFHLGFMPAPGGEKFTLATGWAWAVAAPDPLRRAMAAELSDWLTDPEFLAEWTQAQGVLPSSAAVLELWPAGIRRALAAGILEEAPAFPIDEITAFAGPILAKAARRVLLEGVLPAEAAAEAAKAVHP